MGNNLPSVFPAQAYSPDGGDRISGQLELSDMGVTFRAETGASVLLPLTGLTIKRGGASNRLVFLSHPTRPGWQIFTAETALLKHPVLHQHEALRAVKQDRRRDWHRFTLLVTASLLALVLLGFGLWWSLDGVSRVAAKQVPRDWEENLGQTVLAQYQLSKNFMPDAKAQALLKPLTDPLLAVIPKPGYAFNLHIVDDPTINAFALPGGTVVIHTGLILKARQAGELQGVLAHEIAHVTEQHGVRGIIRSTGLFVIAQALLGDATGLAALAANAGPLLLNMKYSRDFERDADKKGFDFLVAANIHPQGMVSFFEIVKAEQEAQLKKISDVRASDAMKVAERVMGSHPQTQERIANLNVRIKGLQPEKWRNDEAAFLALQQEVKAFVSERAAAKPQATSENRQAEPAL